MAVLALASACTGGSATPRTLPSITPTASASATPIAIPSEATVHNAFGAAAFVRFYYSQLNKAYEAASSEPLEGLSDPGCGTCKNYVQATIDLKSRGQRLQGESLVIVSAEAPPEQNGFVAVDVVMYAPDRKVIDSSGSVVQSYRRGPQVHKTVYVKRTPGAWVVRAVQAAK